MNGNNVDITDNLVENMMAWSPQTGLWILEGKLHLHSGMFTCKLTVPGTKKSITQTQRIFIKLIGGGETTLISPR